MLQHTTLPKAQGAHRGSGSFPRGRHNLWKAERACAPCAAYCLLRVYALRPLHPQPYFKVDRTILFDLPKKRAMSIAKLKEEKSREKDTITLA